MLSFIIFDKNNFSMFKLFDLTLQLNGFPMKKAKEELNKIVSLSEKDHQLFIKNKKQEIVGYHLKNNKSYREFVESQVLKIGTNYQ